jgi:Na+/H+ antiporter NhaC
MTPFGAAAQEVSDPPVVVLRNVPFDLTLNGVERGGTEVRVTNAEGRTLARTEAVAAGDITLKGLEVASGDDMPLTIEAGSTRITLDATVTSGWFSILPPALAILVALLLREVVIALFAGVWLGALAVAGFNPLAGTGRVIDTFMVPSIADESHASIMVFSLLLGGMVGIIARNGGTLGIVEAVAPLARSRRRGKLATWLAGMAIFFDDYANTLIVGNTMRPITDRLKISREKLAYLVDSTAAPVAALVPISTWVGYEISLIADGMAVAAGEAGAQGAALTSLSPFGVFLQTIPFLFYPLLALVLVFLTSWTDRDFGPMAKAEERAARGGGLFREGASLAADTSSSLMQPKADIPHRWWNGALPVASVVLVVLLGLYRTGRAGVGPDAGLMEVFGAADPFATLLWGSLAGVIVAVVLSWSQKILTMEESIEATVSGMRSMMLAMIILVLAWSLGDVTTQIGTADFLAQLLSDRVALPVLPLIVFVTSAAMAFATGTSWGTMAIVIPLVIPLTAALGGPAVYPGAPDDGILLSSIASVLAGAIFGDHCSPISDTTVLSSTASACDHVDHVRTQMPYALLVAAVAGAASVASGYGLSPWLALLFGVVAVAGLLRWLAPTPLAEDGAD